MKLSIIVPCYKRVNQTKKTLKLLLASRGWGKDFESELIVADCTPDSSLKKALQIFGRKVRYVRPQEPGISVNKNAGARVAKGDILIFCDSDIEVEKETLKEVVVAFQKHPKTAMLMGKAVWRGGEKDGQNDRPRIEDRILEYRGTKFVEAIYGRFMATYKDLFWQVGGFDEELFNMRGEGSDLSIRYWRSGAPLVFEPKVKTHHVFGASDAITRNIAHPERGIIRDLVVLGFKYGLIGKDGNFAKTLVWLKKWYGESDKYAIIESVVELLPYFVKNWEKIKESKKAVPNKYDFKFLEIFSDRKLFERCVDSYDETKNSPTNSAVDRPAP